MFLTISLVMPVGFALLAVGVGAVIAVVPRADSGWYLLVPLLLAGSGLGGGFYYLWTPSAP